MKKIIIIIAILILVGVGYWFFSSQKSGVSSEAPQLPLSDVDKVNILEKLSTGASPSTTPATVDEQRGVLQSLEKEQVKAVGPSDEEKIKILQSLQGSN